MAKVTFKGASVRAFREAGEFVRLPKWSAVVTVAAGAVGVACLGWWSTGHFVPTAAYSVLSLACLFLLIFIVKLFSVPIAIANEAATKQNDLAEKVEALEQRIAILSAPPPPPVRDPDGIYQHGVLVAKVVLPLVDVSKGLATFNAINSGAEFNFKDSFEYREWRLLVIHADLESTATMNGQVTNSLRGVQATLTGRR